VPNGGIISGGATLQTVTIPTDLTILPRINADDSVTALINPVITTYSLVEVPTSSDSGGTQQVPLTSQNSLSTLLNIKDGETMVIGGFVNRNETKNKIKIPLLSDLPIIGNLFFTRTENNINDSELLIFVTPHVIKDDTETTTLGPY
jgi:type II secretory pathway component GspD/PulD (secretin)